MPYNSYCGERKGTVHSSITNKAALQLRAIPAPQALSYYVMENGSLLCFLIEDYCKHGDLPLVIHTSIIHWEPQCI